MYLHGWVVMDPLPGGQGQLDDALLVTAGVLVLLVMVGLVVTYRLVLLSARRVRKMLHSAGGAAMLLAAEAAKSAGATALPSALQGFLSACGCSAVAVDAASTNVKKRIVLATPVSFLTQRASS